MSDTVGDLNVIRKREEMDVEWKINNLDSLTKTLYRSHDFVFAGETWNLGIYPNGKSTRGYIDLYLYCLNFSALPISVKFSFALKTLNGQNELEKHSAGIFKGRQHDIERFLLRSEFIKRKSEFVDSGFFTVVCKLKGLNSTTSASGIATANCSFCNKIFNTEEISFHEKKCKVKCPECLSVVLYKNWHNHECQISRVEASEKLIHDFETAMLTGELSDVIVKVKDVEFKLHKSILATRNPYFSSMFKNDMKEKCTGIVTIEDCRPDVFRSFIYFLYTGKIDKLSSENAWALYEAADKYQEDQLKKECLYSMLSTLSVDSFCDYIVLALKYDEKELFEKAVQFFILKAKEIGCSVKWQTFVKEYPVQANELFLKAIDHYELILNKHSQE